ncbi:MAG: bifunctional hydroxymethylpyrimidine kinase/phosphomethylpyrimidine kinase [Nitrospirota bacterium]|nr:bifunctional hydroxymethylpyrimidine kinase/phosphomethylpyrimidine kinase [Nitrospirota bacterium]
MKTALTIAGSDPTSGAGAQLDIKVFQRIGVHGLSVLTSITAQNSAAVKSIHPVEPHAVKEQLAVLLEDVRVDALKTGMLYSSSIVEVVSGILKKYGIKKVVVDPVMVSSSGMPLVEEGTVEKMMEILFPLTTIITPNIYEASLLSGINIEGFDALYEAAGKIKDIGPEIVIITGGHFSATEHATSRGSRDAVVDLYYDGSEFHRIESERFAGEYHGTGCAFTSALTAYLALGNSALEASRTAKKFTVDAIRNAYYIGSGMRMLRV